MESKKVCVFGVLLAMAVALIGTSTSSIGADGLVGGGGTWGWVDECTACSGETRVYCDRGPLQGCHSNSADVCLVGNDGSGRTCKGTGNNPCGGTQACSNAEETDCGR